MAREAGQGRWGLWEGSEPTLIRLFLLTFAVIAVVVLIRDVLQRDLLDLSPWRFLLGLGRVLVVAYAISSFILGFHFTSAFHREGIVPMRELVSIMVQVSIIVGAFFSLLLAMDLWGWLDTGIEPANGAYFGLPSLPVNPLLLVFFVLVTVGTLVSMAVVLVGGFGIIGMLYTFNVGGVPRLALAIEGISRREDAGSRALMWLLTIPAALDTDVVLMDEPAREASVPWGRFRSAVLWQVAFGIVMAIYVSLNPWLLRDLSMNELFRFMSTAFVVVPILVIPWFIHRRLNVRIKGVGKDFTMYAALKDRFLRVIIAAGTILIFLRLAWEDYTLMDILAAFSSYIFIMVLCTVSFTFIYFNFFENRLAEECFRRWRSAREASEGSANEPLSEETSSTGQESPDDGG